MFLYPPIVIDIIFLKQICFEIDGNEMELDLLIVISIAVYLDSIFVCKDVLPFFLKIF
jgi:hypothetical protein